MATRNSRWVGWIALDGRTVVVAPAGRRAYDVRLAVDPADMWATSFHEVGVKVAKALIAAGRCDYHRDLKP